MRKKTKEENAAIELKNPGILWRRNWRHHLSSNYGFSVEEYEAMLIKQGGRCAICRCTPEEFSKRQKKARALSVDHCHKSGIVRGLLCNSCNAGIGLLGDDISRVEAARRYLERHT